MLHSTLFFTQLRLRSTVQIGNFKWIGSVALAIVCLGLYGNVSAQTVSLWFDDHKPKPQVAEALRILSQADREGLRPEDYQAKSLETQLKQISGLSANAKTAAQKQFESVLTAALLRFMKDLQQGRIQPHQIHENFDAPKHQQLDLTALLHQAIEQRKLTASIQSLAPTFPLYPALKKALARYQDLTDHPAWKHPLPALKNNKIEPGSSYEGTAVLLERLVALGDLPADSLAPGPIYQGKLVDGIKAFQIRHGLQPDGIIGRGTMEQLQIHPGARAKQIALSMERLRWTPLQHGNKMIVVNIPAFMLHAYQNRPDGSIDIQVEMKVIIGKALNTQTPLFDEDMRMIEFSPYWNIPPSIARNETIPAIRKDPSYIQKQQLEFVDSQGNVYTSVTAARLDAVLAGTMRIRQRPGPHNALGDIKFIFPNNDHIYMHHTPAVQLFHRSRRDFSHGCIRLEEPVALAKFVLADEPAWTESRIRAAMDNGKSSTIRLKQPIPVVIAYSTAMVKNGKVFFYSDIYGHDKLLSIALDQRTRSAPTAKPN